MRLFKSPRTRSILPWLLGGLMLGMVLTLILIVGGLFTRNRRQMPDEVIPFLTIIPAPSVTPTSEPSRTPEIAVLTPTSTPGPTYSGEIGQGQLVEIAGRDEIHRSPGLWFEVVAVDGDEIFGTGGDNLRLRVRPGLDATIASLGVESEVFEVLDGPREMDGYAWWHLRNPYNTDKTGWAVSVYLRPISSP